MILSLEKIMIAKVISELKSVSTIKIFAQTSAMSTLEKATFYE